MVLHARRNAKVVLRGLLLLALVVQAFGAKSAQAQLPTATVTWTGLGTTNNWSDSGNWVNGVIPTSDSSYTLELIFPAGVAAINRDSNNDLSLVGQTTIAIHESNYQLNGNSLKVGTIRATYPPGWGSTIGLPIVATTQLDVYTTAGGSLFLDGAISGSANVDYYGTGKVALFGSGSTVNSYTGSTTICATCSVSAYFATAFGSTSGKTVVRGELMFDAALEEDLELDGATVIGSGSVLGDITLLSYSEFFPSATLSISGTISGYGGLMVRGPERVIFEGASANTYSGPTIVAGGVLHLNKPSGILAVPGDLSLSAGGRVELLASNQLRDTSNIYVGEAAILDMNTASQTIAELKLYNGTVKGSGTIRPEQITSYGHSEPSVISSRLGLGTSMRNIYVENGAAGEDLLISGVIGGNGGGFTKTGDGQLALAEDNNFTGIVVVMMGKLRVSNETGSATGTGHVYVNSNGTLSGTGRISGNVTIENDGTLAPGAPSGQLRVGNLTLRGQANLNFRLGTPNVTTGGNNDYLKVNGNLTLNGVLNITSTTGFGNGTYALIEYTGTLTDNGLVVGSGPNGHSYVPSTGTAGRVNLIVS